MIWATWTGRVVHATRVGAAKVPEGDWVTLCGRSAPTATYQLKPWVPASALERCAKCEAAAGRNARRYWPEESHA